MTDRDDVLDAADERRLAVSLFNATWPLLRRMGRSPEGDLRILHMAHASRYHWGEVGEPVNLARGEWLCSRVYAVLGRPEPARFHAERSLQLCEIHGIGDFDLAYAHEALARAHRVAGDVDAAAAEAIMARDLADGIADSDDRDHFLSDLADLPPVAPAGEPVDAGPTGRTEPRRSVGRTGCRSGWWWPRIWAGGWPSADPARGGPAGVVRP